MTTRDGTGATRVIAWASCLILVVLIILYSSLPIKSGQAVTDPAGGDRAAADDRSRMLFPNDALVRNAVDSSEPRQDVGSAPIRYDFLGNVSDKSGRAVGHAAIYLESSSTAFFENGIVLCRMCPGEDMTREPSAITDGNGDFAISSTAPLEYLTVRRDCIYQTFRVAHKEANARMSFAMSDWTLLPIKVHHSAVLPSSYMRPLRGRGGWLDVLPGPRLRVTDIHGISAIVVTEPCDDDLKEYRFQVPIAWPEILEVAIAEDGYADGVIAVNVLSECNAPQEVSLEAGSFIRLSIPPHEGWKRVQVCTGAPEIWQPQAEVRCCGHGGTVAIRGKEASQDVDIPVMRQDAAYWVYVFSPGRKAAYYAYGPVFPGGSRIELGSTANAAKPQLPIGNGRVSVIVAPTPLCPDPTNVIAELKFDGQSASLATPESTGRLYAEALPAGPYVWTFRLPDVQDKVISFDLAENQTLDLGEIRLDSPTEILDVHFGVEGAHQGTLVESTLYYQDGGAVNAAPGKSIDSVMRFRYRGVPIQIALATRFPAPDGNPTLGWQYFDVVEVPELGTLEFSASSCVRVDLFLPSNDILAATRYVDIYPSGIYELSGQPLLSLTLSANGADSSQVVWLGAGHYTVSLGGMDKLSRLYSLAVSSNGQAVSLLLD